MKAYWPLARPGISQLVNRNVFLWPVALVLALLAGNGSVQPEQPTKVLAWVGTSSPDQDRSFQRFTAAVSKHHLAAAAGLRVDYVPVRAAGRPEVLHDLRSRRQPPPLAWLGPTDTAAWAAIHTLPLRPVVFSTHPDPVLAGLVSNPRRPGGQATGVVHGEELHAKRLEILRDAFPRLRTVGVLLDTGWLKHQDVHGLLLDPAQRLGLQLRLVAVDDPAAVVGAMQAPAVADVDAWYIPTTYIAYLAEPTIIRLMAEMRMPAMHGTERAVMQGALMAYAQDTSYTAEALADLALRVAMGERAGDIPVQRPRRFVLSVRPRDEPAALRLPAHLVKRADRVH